MEMITKVIGQFSTTGFTKYPLSNNTLINNYKVIHLINHKLLLIKGNFQYIKTRDYI